MMSSSRNARLTLPNRRAFIEAVIETCTGNPTENGPYGLLATSSLELFAAGPAALAAAAAHGAGIGRTVRDLAQSGCGIQTLVLVKLDKTGAPVDIWVVDGWSLIRAGGERLDLRGASLRGAQLSAARLEGADLEDADLSGADLERADLAGANLTGANLSGATLSCANLRGADLTETELCRANLRHADLRGTVCVRTAMRGADLWNAYTWNVDLSQAFVTGTDLSRADHLNDDEVDKERDAR